MGTGQMVKLGDVRPTFDLSLSLALGVSDLVRGTTWIPACSARGNPGLSLKSTPKKGTGQMKENRGSGPDLRSSVT
jgi:hypothetical protein